MEVDEKHPVVAGLTALVAVGLAAGLALGAVVLVATQLLGLGGSDVAAETSNGPGASLYLPDPTDTGGPTGPLITLAPGESWAAPTTSAPAASQSSEAPAGLTLASGETEVGSMDRIDLTGVYPDGEGAVLQVQRRSGDGGRWEDFPVTAAVNGASFSTYVQTGRAGKQDWRVKDTDTGTVSNVVTVTVR